MGQVVIDITGRIFSKKLASTMPHRYRDGPIEFDDRR
jgi:hypothetical protein